MLYPGTTSYNIKIMCYKQIIKSITGYGFIFWCNSSQMQMKRLRCRKKLFLRDVVQIYGNEDPQLEVPTAEDDGKILPPPSIEEAVRAMQLKNHKLPEANRITTELLNLEATIPEVHQVMLKVWDSKSIHDD